MDSQNIPERKIYSMKDPQASGCRWQILNLLYHRTGLSRVDLARLLGVSKSTISMHVDALMDMGLCKKAGEENSNGQSGQGRKPTLLSFCADYRYLLLLDFGQVQPRLAITDLLGCVLGQKCLTFEEENSQEALVEALLEATQDLLRTTAISPDQLVLLAVAAPGIVNPHESKLVVDGFYGKWDLLGLGHHLATSYGLKVFFYNDVNAAAWGEYIMARSSRDNLVYLAGGSGLGLGIILNGELYLGRSGSAGEISHLLVSSLSPLCPSDEVSLALAENRYIPLSSRASFRVLLKELNRQKQVLSESRSGRKNVLDNQDFLNLLKMGDVEAHRLAQSMGESLAILIYNLVMLLDTELIVLDRAYQPFVKHIDLTLKCLGRHFRQDEINISVSTLGEKAANYGLADLAVEKLITRWAVQGGKL